MGAIEKLETEADAGGQNLLVPLAGKKVEVIPIGQWRSSAMRAIREGDWDLFAEMCLTPKGLKVWDDVDPTNDQIGAFFEDWAKASGQSLGESRASRRSSRSTARR